MAEPIATGAQVIARDGGFEIRVGEWRTWAANREYADKFAAEGPPAEVRDRGGSGWWNHDGPRHLEDLTPDQRRLVQALVAAGKRG